MEASKRSATNGSGNAAKKVKKENGGGGGGIDLLDTIMQDMENTYGNAVLPELTDFITVEVSKIFDKNPTLSRRSLENSTQQQLELEVRLGRWEDSFIPGLLSDKTNMLMAAIEKDGYDCSISHVIDFIYEDGNSSLRLTANPDSLRVESGCAKTRYAMRDVASSKMQMGFDFRVGLALEQEDANPIFLGGSQMPPANWIQKRDKWRRSYQKPADDWRIDMTVVNTAYPGGGSRMTHEVELELKPSAVEKLENHKTAQQVVSQLWDRLLFLNKALGDFVLLPNFPSVSCGRVMSDKLIPLKHLCLQWFSENNDVSSSDAFPGSLPVSFSRKHYPNVLNESYWVSDKTDGTRFLLFIVPAKASSHLEGVYFIDRKFSFYRIKGMDFLIQIYAPDGVTLLDGEMVNHIDDEETLRSSPMFLIFDLMVVNGTSFLEQTLTARLERIGSLVESYRTHQSSPSPSREKHSFSLIGKKFFDKRHFAALLKCFVTKPSGTYFVDQKRYHKTDGIIFTPEQPYATRGVHNLYKWKLPTHLTIDFKLSTRQDGKMSLLCRGNDGDVEVSYVEFIQKDRDRLERDRQKVAHSASRAPPTIIIEARYDIWKGLWRYHGIRTDKSTANHIRIAFETMVSIAENVTLDELYYRLTNPRVTAEQFQVNLTGLIASKFGPRSAAPAHAPHAPHPHGYVPGH
eukprot:TRINITY_DN7637_c0_g1_i1.p1 TRINITY_DN7637_c0_g1~~TRINITY_DN7637_c0_g1_i1.p1  ORF type:complete len:686 (+),score=120.98 TRINITY_DN7637_c0_g1_i1:243-2300(+)